MVAPHKASGADFEAAHRFLEGFGKSAPDGHHFADALHLWAKDRIDAGEFFKGPTGDFDHHIVEAGLKRSWCQLGDIVGDFVEGIAYRQQGGDFGDGEAGGLGRQRRRPADAGVHFDDKRRAGFGVDRELNV